MQLRKKGDKYWGREAGQNRYERERLRRISTTCSNVKPKLHKENNTQHSVSRKRKNGAI